MINTIDRKKPLYRYIADVLRERIATEHWLPDDALPSRRALAEELGTTHITVDKAVGQLVREGLLTATIGSGTYVTRQNPTPIAVSPRRNGTTRIGIVLGSMTFRPQETSLAKEHIYFGPMLNGIQDGFFGSDVEVNYEGVLLSDVERLKTLDFDGLLVLAPSLFDLEYIRNLAKSWKIVVVGLSSNILPEVEMLPCVDTGNVLGGYLATRHLIELGHKSIGFINLSFNSANHFDRHKGFLKALEEARIKIAPEHMLMAPCYYTQIPVERTIDPWIQHLAKTKRLPTAIFSCDYTTTIAILDSLEQHGISVPGDISVVGYDDGPRFEYRNPPITAVYQPAGELGRRAAERLMMILDGKPGSNEIGTEQLVPVLHVRATTAPPHSQ